MSESCAKLYSFACKPTHRAGLVFLKADSGAVFVRLKADSGGCIRLPVSRLGLPYSSACKPTHRAGLVCLKADSGGCIRLPVSRLTEPD